MTILILIGSVEPKIDVMFRGGWKSVAEILLLFALVAAFYPKLAFIKKLAEIPGETSEIEDDVISFMDKKGYLLEKKEDDNLFFRLKSKTNRLTRMFEDRLTFTRALGGYEIEGLSKDIWKVVGPLEYEFKQKNEENVD